MGFLEKIQKISDFWKKVIMFGALFVLAIPFSFLVIKNFNFRVSQIGEKDFLERINFSSGANESPENQFSSTTDIDKMFSELELLQDLIADENATETNSFLGEDSAYIYEDETATTSDFE